MKNLKSTEEFTIVLERNNFALISVDIRVDPLLFMSNFQIGLIIFFVAFVIIAMLIFSGFIPVGGKKAKEAAVVSTIEVWGSLKKNTLAPFIGNFNTQNQNLKINYVEKNAATFDQELTEALANGQSPDLFIVSNDNLLTLQRRIAPIPFASFPEANFRNTFIAEADMFMTPNGLLALPFVVDPVIMFYNKSLLDGAGVAVPPKYWDELTTLAPVLTKKDEKFNINQSAAALGSFSNINNAKDILTTLFVQAGNPIFVKAGTIQTPVLDQSFGQTIKPAEAVLRFYTEFSNPAKEAYSWNRASLNSKDSFLSQGLVFYFGFASELLTIQSQNPNLIIDIRKILQNRDANVEATFGRIYGFTVSNRSKQPVVAFQAVNLLTNQANSLGLAQSIGLPPVRRDMLAVPPISPYQLKTFYESAIISRGFADPNPSLTEETFKEMVESVASNKATISQAVSQANQSLGGR